MENNKYINSFDAASGYTMYLSGSTIDTPNLAEVDGSLIYTDTKGVPDSWIIYGTTTGTTDFYIGAANTSTTSSASNGIHLHVVETPEGEDNYFYAEASDVVGTIAVFYSNKSGFSTTEGQKITSILKWTYDTSSVTSLYLMFSDCSSLKYVDLSHFTCENVTNIVKMFRNCKSLVSIDMSSMECSGCNIEQMIEGSTNLKYLDISGIKSTSGTNKLVNGTAVCLKTLITGPGFFKGVSTIDLSKVTGSIENSDSKEILANSICANNGTGKTVKVYVKSIFTQGQQDKIAAMGWNLTQLV